MAEIERDPDRAPPSGPLTHWVDTNVMLEVYSQGDVYDAYEGWQRGEIPIANVEARRIRMQGSLWMAMALCEARAISVSFQHENLNNILRMAPPGSERGGWTSAILYVLGDGGVFDGWERFLTNDGLGLSNRNRDRHMVNECRTGGLVLVTRDDQVIGEARNVGVDVAEPEAFAARYLTRDAARRMCEERVATATFRYLTRGPVGEHELRMRIGHRIRELYGAIWQPPDQPWFREI